MIEQWNQQLFLLLNASGAPSPFLRETAWLAAEWIIYVVAIGLALAWIRADQRIRRLLLVSVSAALAGLLVNQIIALFYYHPRPFEIGLGQQILPHGRETSFPSDHATVLWALGFCLVGDRKARIWGGIVTALGVMVAWSRIYLGVHFPFDMLGALLVSALCAWIALRFEPLMDAHVFPLAQRAYESVVRALHLPRWLFK